GASREPPRRWPPTASSTPPTARRPLNPPRFPFRDHLRVVGCGAVRENVGQARWARTRECSRSATRPEGSRMPLSDEEQKILREIEAQLSASDPALAQQVKTSTVYRHAGRNIKWAGLGFVVGLVLIVFTFAT